MSRLYRRRLGSGRTAPPRRVAVLLSIQKSDASEV